MKRLTLALLLSAVSMTLSACSLSNLVDGVEVSSETRDPVMARTPQGALAAYRGTQIVFARAISIVEGTSHSGLVYVSGLLSDELRAQNMASDFPNGSDDGRIDSRTGVALSTSGLDPFRDLHRVRGNAQEARGLVKEYVPGEWRDLYAHLYAIEAYADIFLADLFCSGIPLSQVSYRGDFIMTRGYTTAEVYEEAMKLFDSAEVYIRDSTMLIHFINVGRGRALIATGRYAEAAEVVRQVPDNYQYQIRYSASFAKETPRPDYLFVADGDGNGIRFISDHDPRATLPVLLDKAAPLTLASGVEARLIAIESQIHQDDDGWIIGLNALRTTCIPSETCPDPAPPGIGNVENLAPLIDSTQALSVEERFIRRIDILFRERAYWLFLTGHRQGDLRRLVREYGRHEQTVYPSGLWGSKGFTAYGIYTNLAIPDAEARNPLYQGCIHREA